jgi:hypothetical protein
MDRHQLVIIAITAVISVVAKEVVMWLVSLVKTIAVTETIRKKVKKIFSKNNLNIILDILVISFDLWVLVRDLRNPRPMVRTDIIWIILDLICLAAFVGRFLFHVARISGKITVSWGDEGAPPESK